jgi:hypothetical protein
MAKIVAFALKLYLLAIYKWLDKKFDGEGYQDGGGVREALHEAFDIYMVQ